MRFLHAADVHLDSPLRKLSRFDDAPVDRIVKASRRALARMVDLAIDQKVDLVLIAGDLYDGDWPDQNTGLHFVRQAARLIDANIPILVIRGNHDAENVMTSSLPLPANPDGSTVMLASDRVESRVVGGLAIHGRSFETKSVTENLSIDYPVPHSGLFNIGMLHTSLTGAEGHDTYSPCTPDYLTNKSYDYWALGHIHTRGDRAIEGGPPIIFPGNLSGRHIRETGPKGCVIVDVDSGGKPTVTFHELDDVRWEIVSIDASELSHVDDVGDAFRDALIQTLDLLRGAVHDPMLVVRVEIVGATPLDAKLRSRVDAMAAELRAVAIAMAGQRVWLEAVRVRTRTPPRATDAIDDGPLRSVHAALEAMRSNPNEWIQKELDPLIRKLPPEMQGDASPFAIDDDRWSSELIDEVAAELEARLGGDA